MHCMQKGGDMLMVGVCFLGRDALCLEGSGAHCELAQDEYVVCV